MLAGTHHITTLTADMDRLIAFYERVLDARVLLDLTEEGLRHAFIALGRDTVLHPFEVPGVEVPQGEIPMFARGRIDHFGLHVESEEALHELRRRIVDAGVAEGELVDMGVCLSISFVDPDGLSVELFWSKPGANPWAPLKRAEWTRMSVAA